MLEFSGDVVRKLRSATTLRISSCADVAVSCVFPQVLEIARSISKRMQSRKIGVLCAAKCISGHTSRSEPRVGPPDSSYFVLFCQSTQSLREMRTTKRGQVCASLIVFFMMGEKCVSRLIVWWFTRRMRGQVIETPSAQPWSLP